MGEKKNTRKAESIIPNKMEVMGERGKAGIEKWESEKFTEYKIAYCKGGMEANKMRHEKYHLNINKINELKEMMQEPEKPGTMKCLGAQVRSYQGHIDINLKDCACFILIQMMQMP